MGDYQIVESVRSKYDSERILRVYTDKMTCPRCKTTMRILEHCRSRDCEVCGLHMELMGAILKVWGIDTRRP